MNSVLRLMDHPLAVALGWTVLHFIWEGALIGLIAFALLRIVRPADPASRYAIGVATLATMLVAAVATYVAVSNGPGSGSAPWFAETRTAIAGPLVTGTIVAEASANPAATRQLIPPGDGLSRPAATPRIAPLWLRAVAAAWMIGVLLLSLRLLGGWLLTRSLSRRAVAAASPAIESAAREIARRLDLRHGVAILESAAVSVPTLVGYLRPIVLLPASALSGLTPLQLQAIIAHELAHVRRHDYLINLLQAMVETLLFYHPAVWWVSAEVRAEREHCCDDLAVAVCGDRLVYVSALAELTTLERHTLALAATDGSLLTRVRRILGRPVEPRRELPPSWGILALLVVLVGAGSYEMSTAAAVAEPVAGSAALISQTQVPAGPTVSNADQAPVPAPPTPPPAIRPFDPPSRVPDMPAVPVAGVPPVDVPKVPEAPVTPVAMDLPPLPEVPAAAPAVPQTPTPAAPPAIPAPPPPPAPPAAPAPPAPPPPPPDPPQATTRGEGNFSWSNNGDHLTVKWTGPFRLSDDERDIAWIEEGARVTISSGWVFTDRVELRGLTDGKVERTFYRNGFRQDADSEARLFLANALARMIRSGMFASDRVARILKQGGPDAVLAEIDRLQTDSNYVKRVYYTALLKQAELTSEQLSRVVQRAADGITSDYDKATLLVEILRARAVTDEQRASIARATRHIDSDYEQRRVLSAVLGATPLSAVVASAVIDATESIGSAYDRGLVLGGLAAKGAVTPETSARFMASVGAMRSPYEQRRVLAAVASGAPLAEPVAIDSVKAAGTIASAYDKRQALSAYVAQGAASPKVAMATIASAATIKTAYDKAELLIAIVDRGGFTDETASSFFAAATTIGSSYDLARVLRTAAGRPRLADASLMLLIRAAGSVSSAYDRAAVLLEILKQQSLSSPAREVFLDVAQAITSQHEQNRVLAELVRSERR